MHYWVRHQAHKGSRLQHAQDKTFQVTGFRHARQDRMIARLAAPLQYLDEAVAIARRVAQHFEEIRFRHMVGTA
jgi:hypothetical protein